MKAELWECRLCGESFLIGDAFDPMLEVAEHHMRVEHGFNKYDRWRRIRRDHRCRRVPSWYSLQLDEEAAGRGLAIHTPTRPY